LNPEWEKPVQNRNKHSTKEAGAYYFIILKCITCELKIENKTSTRPRKALSNYQSWTINCKFIKHGKATNGCWAIEVVCGQYAYVMPE